MGLHGQSTCELTFGANDDCYGELVGNEFEGMKNMFVMMNEARLLCGVQGEGQANLAYEMSTQYVKERSQFGAEIIQHPDVKRMMLKMRSMVRGMRALTLYTANLFDLEKQNPGKHIKEIEILTPVCKAYCSDEGFQSAVDAIQVHGGYGYCTEYGIEQFARDIKIATIYEGTNGIQAIDFIDRKILRDQAKTFFYIGEKISHTLRTDEAREFADERRLIIENQFKAEDILKRLSEYAGKKDLEMVLSHATDFLSFCGNIMIAWRHLESACVAKRELAQSPAEDYKKYLESKIVDFKIFCQHYLVRNFAIAKTILEFEHRGSGVDL